MFGSCFLAGLVRLWNVRLHSHVKLPAFPLPLVFQKQNSRCHANASSPSLSRFSKLLHHVISQGLPLNSCLAVTLIPFLMWWEETEATRV